MIHHPPGSFLVFSMPSECLYREKTPIFAEYGDYRETARNGHPVAVLPQCKNHAAGPTARRRSRRAVPRRPGSAPVTARGEIRVGISGWTYPPWRGVFYPKGLRQKDELAFASRRFRTIEINGTFYGLTNPKSVRSWAAETPAGFVFAIKGSRYITHLKRLDDPRQPLANFFASGLLALGEKTGPFLWQLPPSFRFDAERLDRFLALLPRDSAAAGRLARAHDARLEGRALTRPAAAVTLRHAIEVRHKSFETPDFITLLRRHGVAAVVADSVAWPCIADVTADFVYVRLHGSEELYASGYDDAALDRWAARVQAWATGGAPGDLHRIADPLPGRKTRDVYVYFDNDAKVRAPADAAALAARLGIAP
jgi:uncharacterized protein YecE (DUF72 family)